MLPSLMVKYQQAVKNAKFSDFSNIITNNRTLFKAF